MNFENMPELTWELGYPLALALMAFHADQHLVPARVDPAIRDLGLRTISARMDRREGAATPNERQT